VQRCCDSISISEPEYASNNVKAVLATPCRLQRLSGLILKEKFTRGVLRRRQESTLCFSKADLFIVKSLKKTFLLYSRAEENWRCGRVYSGTTDLRLACRLRSIWRPEEHPGQETRQAIRCLPVPSLSGWLAHIQRLRKVCIAGLCGVIYRYCSTGRWAAGLIGCLRKWWLTAEALKGGD
jgi:hypothetical protein